MTALAASDDKAKTIRLEKTEGTVTVVDAAGKPVSLVEGMRLYNGYMVQTASESYAWLSLDDTKSVKMDENTQLELRKRGKKIQLNLISGSILVGASAHLEDDEELTIRTATMITGIRGTDIHASVFVPTPVIVPTEGSRDQVSIQSSKPAVMLSVLDGVVSSQNSKGAVTVSAGETVTVTTDAAPAVTSLSLDELGAFAVQEIKANDALRNRVDNPGMAESGITVDRILDHGGTRLNPGVVNSQTIPTQVKNLGIVKKSGEILHDIRAASTHTHNWGTAEYVWGENHSCTATRTCLSDSSHVERAMVYATEKDTVSATCTATGTQIWIADFGTQSGFETQVARFIIPIDPNAHDFDTPTYSWNGNQCTATRVCKNDTQHVETETVTGTYVMDTAATCTTAETGHYTVSFTNTAFTAQTTAANSVPIGDPLQHDFDTPSYSWNGNQCTAARVCKNDTKHVETETENGTYVMDTAATCATAETGHYAVTFTNTAFAAQTTAANSVPIGDPLQHDFDTPSYSWNGSQCTATRVCKNDTKHVETETENGTYVMDTAATCTTVEAGHYAVTFTNTAFTAQTTAANSVTIGNPLNHDYGTPSYSWNGSQCTATRVCKNDTKHVETETVTGAYSKDTDATCTTAETGHYTASFTNTAFTTQTTALNSITNGDPLGHSEPEANAWSYITDPQNSAEPGYYTYTCTRGCTVTELEYLNQALAAATAPVDAPYGQINGSKTDKPENKVLTIPAGKTLNADSLYVAYGYQVIVKGTLNVTGSIENYGTITVETGGKLNVTDPEAEYSESSLMNCATYTTQEQEEVIIEAVLTCSGEIVADRINNSGEIQLIGGSVTTQYLSSSSVLDIKQSSVLTTDSFCSFSGDYDSGSVTVDGSTFTLKKTEGSENSNEGSISVSNSGTLNIFDNLYADNGSITVDNTSAMNVTGTEEYDISVRTILNNSGTVNVSNASLYLIAPNPEGEEIAETLPIVENAGSITLAKNAQLYYEGELNETTVYGTLLNSGSISLSGSYVWAEVQNTGTITARLDSSYIYSVSNLSTIEVNKDAKLTVYFLNNAVEEQKTGSVAVDGTLILDSGKEQTMYSTNDGSILIRDGGSLELNTTLYHSGSMSVSGTVETGSLQYTVISAITNTEDPAYAWPAEGTSSAIGDLICCEGGSITVDGGTLKYNAMTPMPNEL